MPFFASLGPFLLDTLFPPQCISCARRLARSEKNPSVICEACYLSIPIESGLSCPVCNKRFYRPRDLCHPEALCMIASAAPFSSLPLQALIHALKYQSCKSAAIPLANLLRRYLSATGLLKALPSTTVVLPVPLHPRRERRRGFNQAEFISKALFPELSVNVPRIDSGNLVRARNTPSQTKQKNYAERSRNVSGSFRLLFPERVRGRTIILLDDVYTSGATVREAAQICKTAGARRIIALTVARAR